MLALTFVILAQRATLPEIPSFDYSGIPFFTGASQSDLLIRGHSAVLDVNAKDVRVSTTTEVKNQSNHAVSVRLVVPRRREGDETSGFPSFSVRATWGQTSLALRPASSRGNQRTVSAKHVQYESDLTATVTLQPGATYGLRTSYTVPLGHAAADGKTKLTGYALEGNNVIGQFNISYRTANGAVFRLPVAHPALDWQIGTAGAFAKQTNFTPAHQLSWITFYAGGFE